MIFFLSFAALGWLGREIFAGIYQAYHSLTSGLWFARSPEIIHSRVMEALVWLRVPGDVVFAIGGFFLAVYAAKLLRRAQERLPETAPAVEFR